MAASFILLQQPDGSWAKALTDLSGGVHTLVVTGSGGGGIGTVTSVALSGGTTGLTVSGSPITTSGTITLAGTLAVANGGTGGITATAARTNLELTKVRIGVPVNGVPTASATLMCIVPQYPVDVDLNVAGAWQVTSLANVVNATASTTYSVNKNGVQQGTIVIAAGTNTATISAAGSFSLNGTTDVLTITAPASPDATHANFSIQALLTRT